MDKKINEWKKLTNEITENWIRNYFELEDDEEVTVDWIANNAGNIFGFSDYFFNFSDVLDCYKYNIIREKLFLWYEYCLNEQFVNISLAKYILSPEERLKKSKKIWKI